MIKYNNSDIIDWNFDDNDIIKVYHNGAIVFYKFDTEQGGYKVCYAVVDDITQYSETEFEDVYDKATAKWYKLNNLNQYEEYGVYGSGKNITYYEGKLTVDDGYEYEWNGSSWVNLGEVSGSSVVEYIETPTSSPYAGIELLTSPSSQSTPMYYEVDCLVKSSQGDNSILGQKSLKETVSYQMGFESYSSPYYDYGGGRLQTNWSAIGGLNNRIKVGFGVNSGDSKVIIKNLNTSTIIQSTTATPKNVTIPLLCNANYNTNTSGDNYATNGQVRYYGIKIYDNNVLVGDYIPTKNPSTNEYTFYETISQLYCSKIGTGTIAGHEETNYEYPKYYSEQSDPPNNLFFSTMEEADDYAYNNCVYVGLNAAINGDKYVFSGDSQSGYEWVYNPSRLPVGYTEVEYIQNTGTSYLDTAIKVKGTYKIEAEMQQVTETNYGRLFGCGTWNGTYGLQFAYQDYSGIKCIHMHFFGTSGWNSNTSFAFDYLKHTYTYNDGVFSIDSSQAGASTSSTGYTAQDNLGVFTYIASGRPSSSGYWGQEHMKGKMYSFKIWDENDTLVRDLVPCIRDNDNTVGAYDLVNDVFYTVPIGYTTDKLVAGKPV